MPPCAWRMPDICRPGSYDRHMHMPEKHFLNKIMFVLNLNHECFQCASAVYKTFMLCDEEPILGSIMLLNKGMAYEWHMSSLCKVYTWII